MFDKAEHDLAIEHRTIRVNGVPTDGLFELRCGGDGEIYLICEHSARVYASTVAEAEMLASDILQLVEQVRLAESVA